MALAAVAGFVDAVGFIALGGYFLSFMTGNTTRLAVELASGNVRGALIGLSILSAFVVGVVVGTIVGDRAGRRRRSAVLVAVAVLLLAAGGLNVLGATTLMAAVVLAAAMGAENAVFEGERSVSLTYMTGTLVTMARALAEAIQGRKAASWVEPLTRWGALLLGALAGALVYGLVGSSAPAVALVVVLVAAALVFRSGE